MTTGVLCIHGFSGGPYEVAPFAAYIRTHTNWTVSVPTLTGHGEKLSLRGVHHTQWLMDAELAFLRLLEKVDEVIVVGFSMGGLLALYLAKRYKVKKLILLSAAIKYLSLQQLTKDLWEILQDAKVGVLNENKLYQRYKWKLNNVSIFDAKEFVGIVKVVKPYLSHIKTPTWIIQGKLDGIVPTNSAQYLYNKLSSEIKELYFSEQGKHHICFSDDCDRWFSRALEFMIAK